MEWIKITDKQPDKDTLVLSLNKHFKDYYVGWISYDNTLSKYYCYKDGEEVYGITHWAKLDLPTE